MTIVAHPPTKGNRTIRLPIGEHEYDRFLTARSYAKARLQALYEDYSELFPAAFPWVMLSTASQTPHVNNNCAVVDFVSKRLRRLRAWAKAALSDSAMKTHTLELCDKRAQFSRSYDHRYAHRTSKMVDRLIKFLDRACFNGQYFHGTFEAAESRVRAWALLWHFCPSSPSTVSKYHGQACPA
jgi:hypothetical protein